MNRRLSGLLLLATVVAACASGCMSPRLTVRHLDATSPDVLVVVDGVALAKVGPGDEQSVEIRPGHHELAMCIAGVPQPRAAFDIEVEGDVVVDISPATNIEQGGHVRPDDTEVHTCSQVRQSVLAR